MKKSSKIWLITAAVLILAGLAVFAGTMATQNWDLNKLSNIKYETNSFEISDEFDNLIIEAETDDIIFKLSNDDKCKVVCYEQEKVKHSAGVNSKTLEIKVTDKREWYDYIGMFSFDCPKTTVYLPRNHYSSLSISTDTGNIDIPKDFTFNSIEITGSTGDVNCYASSKETTKIKLSTGDITLSDVLSGEINLAVSTGKISIKSATCEGNISVGVSTGKLLISDTKCKDLNSKGSTGNIVLNNVIASQSVSLQRSTGDVTLNECDSKELFIKTSTGDVRGTLLSEKVFITDTSTGEISVPKTLNGGKCEITTSTGDIKINIIA